MDSKKWYLSKTLWLAGGTFIIGILRNFGIVDITDVEFADFVDKALPTITTGLLLGNRFLPQKKLTK